MSKKYGGREGSEGGDGGGGKRTLKQAADPLRNEGNLISISSYLTPSIVRND